MSQAEIERAERAVVDAGGAHRFYGTPITSILTGVGLIGPGASPLRSQLFWRTGICGVLRLRAGKCDLAPGNVLISDRSAQELRVSLGAVILPPSPPPPLPPSPRWSARLASGRPCWWRRPCSEPPPG